MKIVIVTNAVEITKNYNTLKYSEKLIVIGIHYDSRSNNIEKSRR